MFFCFSIKHTYILEDPFADPDQLAELVPDASPEGKPKDEVSNNKKKTYFLLDIVVKIYNLF